MCHQLGQVSVLQYFLERADYMDHQHEPRQAVFLEVLATVVAQFWQKGKGGEWQVIWCLRRPHIIHYVGSLCIFTMWLFNFFLVKRTLRQELQVKETSGKRDRGEFDQHALLHHQAVWKASRPSFLSCRDL